MPLNLTATQAHMLYGIANAHHERMRDAYNALLDGDYGKRKLAAWLDESQQLLDKLSREVARPGKPKTPSEHWMREKFEQAMGPSDYPKTLDEAFQPQPKGREQLMDEHIAKLQGAGNEPEAPFDEAWRIAACERQGWVQHPAWPNVWLPYADADHLHRAVSIKHALFTIDRDATHVCQSKAEWLAFLRKHKSKGTPLPAEPTGL